MRMMRKPLLCGALICGILAVLGGTALADTPAPRFEAFAGCPNTIDVNTCVRADTRGGNIRLGSINTPINHTLTFSGGQTVSGAIAYTSSGGLTGQPLEVPGGLSGLTGLSEILINILTLGANRVQAQAILVDTPTLTLDLTLPIRVKLINPFLVSTCSIGSTASPIVLTMTTGTTAPPSPAVPIRGDPGTLGLDPANSSIFLFSNARYVDNAFSVPTATGCDLLGFGLINGLVNTRVGLPSAAGRNEAIFDRTDVRTTARFNVYP